MVGCSVKVRSSPSAELIVQGKGNDYAHGHVLLDAGFRYGGTPEFGYYTVESRMTIHDLHATLFHRMGLDPTHLPHRHVGRDFRLTDVHGIVAKGITT